MSGIIATAFRLGRLVGYCSGSLTTAKRMWKNEKWKLRVKEEYEKEKEENIRLGSSADHNTLGL